MGTNVPWGMPALEAAVWVEAQRVAKMATSAPMIPATPTQGVCLRTTRRPAVTETSAR